MRIQALLFGLIGPALLTACGASHERPQLYAFTPASVMVEYSEGDMYDAAQTAQQFCHSHSKNAQYVRSEEEDGKRIGFFNCTGSNDAAQTGPMQVTNMPIIMPMSAQAPQPYAMPQPYVQRIQPMSQSMTRTVPLPLDPDSLIPYNAPINWDEVAGAMYQ
jgi:hypothetical protein